MSSRSLEDDLLDIPGVEGAELDGTGDSPAGLRIRIAEGADQRAVGGAIRRVLTKHGLGTDTRLPGEEDAAFRPETDDPGRDELGASDEQDEEVSRPGVVAGSKEPVDSDLADQSEMARPHSEAVPPETVGAFSPVAVLADDADDADASGHVIDLTDLTDGSGDNLEADDSTPGTDVDTAGLEASPDPGSWSAAQAPLVEATATAEVSPQSQQATGESQLKNDFVVLSRIDSVAVEEGRDGIVVTVSATDGRTESQPASSTEGGVESAVVKAASRLAQPGIPDPTIVEIEDRRIEGVDIVMIVLDIDGSVSAGSAIVVAGRSFALGRATWAALSL